MTSTEPVQSVFEAEFIMEKIQLIGTICLAHMLLFVQSLWS